MITKENFINFINHYENYEKEVDRWIEFGINIYENKISDAVFNLINDFIDSHFTYEGKDWIYWYMYERIDFFSKEILPCYDKNENKFFVENANDLWELVKDYLIEYVDNETCEIKGDIS